ncbi:MAG: PadR family transcriptional regulator [Desulfurococcaceae archaeon]|jgi:DNA-binding PadR family transcriptional regulator
MSDKTPRALIRLQRKLTVENLWLYIIKILMEEKNPLRAYDIKVKLRERFSIDPPAVTVYTVVYRMGLDGLLSRIKEGEEQRYKLTETGIEAFHKAIVFLEEVVAKLKL